MATTIRVADDVKRELDRFQGDFLAERGERLSHSELLARLLRFARLHEDRVLGGGRGPPSRDDIDRLLARLPDARTRTRARDAKGALYGRRP
ncbi:MAG TPA: hypothetical protein VGR28_05525 [Candidatus Thermoplasmatota archaeon]|jgi:predicted transcriptional regulator|nr:hypothetical protein [Candidatus Thermoplasmatota archaeon]